MIYRTITKTQEKYLKNLLILQLYGETIKIGGYDWSKRRVSVGGHEYDGRATNTIKKMLEGNIRLGHTQSTDSIHFSEIVFSIKDVLTKLENGKQIMDDVMSGLALYTQACRASNLRHDTYKRLEKEAVSKGSDTFWSDVYDTHTSIGMSYKQVCEDASHKYLQYRNFVQTF